MRKNSVLGLAALLAVALGACGRANQTTGGTAAQSSQVVADGAQVSPAAALQAQLEAAFVGKSTPPEPEGFTSQGGGLLRGPIGVGALWIAYGRWRHAGGEHGVMFVERTTGTEAADAAGRMPGEIVSVYAMPAPLPDENLVDLFCTHPDFSEDTSHIFANAGWAQRRPGLLDPPSAAWRLDFATGRLLPVDDAGRVTCTTEHHLE